jgi:O-antigen/teichoic acid export membrane protein
MLIARRPEPGGLGETNAAAVARGGMWSIAGRLVPQVQILGLSIVAAHYLGPDGLGRQSYIAFAALSLMLLATAGLPAALNRFVAELLGAREGAFAHALYAWTLRALLVTASAAAAFLLLVAALGAEPGGAWVLAGIGCGLAVLQTAPSALLSGAQRWREATIAGLVTGIASVPATAAVLASGGGITGLFAVETVVIAAGLVWTWVLARRLGIALPPAAPVPRELRQRFLRFAGISSLMVGIEFVVWRRSEFFVLNHTSTDAEIALYSIAFASSWGLSRIPGAVAAVAMPTAATLVGAGELERVRAGFWRAARLLLMVTPPLTAAAAAAGPDLIRLVYGEAFAGAGDPLLVLLAPMPLLPLLATSGALLFAFGRLRFLVIVGLVATVVNATFAIALIPPFGAVGAAVSNVIAQLCAGVPALVLTCRLLGPLDLGWLRIGGALAISTVSGLVAAAIVRSTGSAGGVCSGLAIGAILWTVAMLVARPLRTADADWLGTALGTRIGVVARRMSS